MRWSGKSRASPSRPGSDKPSGPPSKYFKAPTSENPLKAKFAQPRSRRWRTAEREGSIFRVVLPGSYVRTPRSLPILYIRSHPASDPGYATFREFQFHAVE